MLLHSDPDTYAPLCPAIYRCLPPAFNLIHWRANDASDTIRCVTSGPQRFQPIPTACLTTPVVASRFAPTPTTAIHIAPAPARRYGPARNDFPTVEPPVDNPLHSVHMPWTGPTGTYYWHCPFFRYRCCHVAIPSNSLSVHHSYLTSHYASCHATITWLPTLLSLFVNIYFLCCYGFHAHRRWQTRRLTNVVKGLI